LKCPGRDWLLLDPLPRGVKGLRGLSRESGGDGRHPTKVKLQVFKHFIQNSSSSSGGTGGVNEELPTPRPFS